MSQRGQRNVQGFTLIEILVVLVILGLTAALVVGRGPQRSAGLEVRSAANRVVQVLREARGQAIATNRPVPVLIGDRSVGIAGREPQLLPPSLLVSWQNDAGRGAVTFAPDGSATGGRIVLSEGSTSRLVVVDWLTGRVRVTDAP